MSRILIIGSEGYIGSYLFNNLVGEKTGIDKNSNDINTRKHSKELTTDFLSKYDVIIYLGGFNGHTQCQNKNYEEVYNENVLDVKNLALKLTNTQLLIYASTAGLLEGSGDTPANESYKIDVDKLTSYTLAMYERENTFITSNDTFTCTTIGLRFGTVAGRSPNQRLDLVYPAMLKSAYLNGYINVYNPDCNRSILYNNDLLNAITTIINNKNKLSSQHSVFNLSSYNTCIAQIANNIACKTGVSTYFNDTQSTINTSSFVMKNDPVGFSSDCSKFIDTFNFTFNGTSCIILDELLSDISEICCKNIVINMNTNDTNICTTCRVCKNKSMYLLLDLNDQPLANNYLLEKEVQKTYPLCLIRCRECFHTQLNYTVPPEEMFKNYQYNSGVSQTLKNYFKFIEKKCSDENLFTSTKVVLELACNDGTQLDIFKERGWETIGVDPATNIIETAKNKGHTTYNIFWGTEEIPDTLLNKNIDVIVAQNVVAHVPDPVLFLQTCYKVMNEHTLLYVQTSQCDMYINGEFDTVYHEHLSYFTLRSMMKAAELSNLILINVEKTPIHGGSFLFTMMKKESPYIKISQNIENMLNEDNEKGVYTDYFYAKYQSKVENIRNWVYKKLLNLKECGYDIIVYGAAAKGMTLLNSIGVDSNIIEYMLDDAEMKHNRYSPNNILIVSPNRLKNIERKTAILVLAWNFSTEIINKINTLTTNTDTLIVIPFPEQKIIKLNGEIVDQNLMIQPQINNIKTVLISHFFNEELLLKWWIRQHSPLFDYAVLIDYNSTDSSLDIIKKEAPSTWKVIKSRNEYFEAEKVDKEVMDIEASFPLEWWKLCLNTTEFLCCPNFKIILNDTPQNINILQISCAMMVGDDTIPLNKNISLVEQRYMYNPNALHTQAYKRFIHRNHTNVYHIGRHRINYNYNIFNEGFLCKYIHTPWPEVLNRRMQIENKIPLCDKLRGFGHNHYYTKEQQEEYTNTAKNGKILLLNDTRTNDKYAKYFGNLHPTISLIY